MSTPIIVILRTVLIDWSLEGHFPPLFAYNRAVNCQGKNGKSIGRVSNSCITSITS